MLIINSNAIKCTINFNYKIYKMKVLKSFLLLSFFMLAVHTMQAQITGVDYYAGKWSILLKALPQGDTKLIFILDKKETTLTGVIQDTTGKEVTKIDKVELSGDQISLYFSAQGYDVTLVMNKKDDDHITGTLMQMFEAEGERVKEEKKLK